MIREQVRRIIGNRIVEVKADRRAKRVHLDQLGRRNVSPESDMEGMNKEKNWYNILLETEVTHK